MAEPEAAGVFHLLSGYALNAVKHAKNWILCAGGSGYYVLPLDKSGGVAGEQPDGVVPPFLVRP